MGTEDDILRAARDLYLEHGLGGLSMRAVAGRAGITATAIYRHYESKEALVGAVCREGFERFGRYLARGLRGASPRERLDHTGDGYFDFAVEQAAYYRIMFMSPEARAVGAEGAGRAREEAAPTFQFLVDRVRECMDEGALAPGDPTGAALTIWAHCHGLVSLYITGLASRFAGVEAFRVFYRASVARVVDGLGEAHAHRRRG